VSRGATGAPGALVVHVAAVDAAVVAASRPYAYAAGRVLERDGLAILTWGVAARWALPLGIGDRAARGSIARRLAAIAPLARPEPGELATVAGLAGGPLALGALTFDPDAWSEVVVPAVAVVARGDERHAIAVGTATEVEAILGRFPFSPSAPPSPTISGEPPDRFELTSVRTHEDFRQRVGLAVEAVRSGALEKVVLAREVAVASNRPLLQHHLLERLRALHPSCCAFAVDGFVGASPELLVRRTGTSVTSQPLAGTVARSGDPEQDRHLAAGLLASAKERAEHRIVVDAIAAALAPYCDHLDAPEVPHLLELRNVAHLATRITGTLHPDAGSEIPGALELVAALHPTPAVGGWPREAALDYIRKCEDLDRDRYAGPVGWVRADGDGEWWLGIRSAVVSGSRARLLAGVGIVDGSDPASELRETQLKLQALLAAAVRP
jgi:menaquinone-specific isochorismate synthase